MQSVVQEVFNLEGAAPVVFPWDHRGLSLILLHHKCAIGVINERVGIPVVGLDWASPEQSPEEPKVFCVVLGWVAERTWNGHTLAFHCGDASVDFQTPCFTWIKIIVIIIIMMRITNSLSKYPCDTIQNKRRLYPPFE